MKKRVLFVCTHNSCRSQMAEGLLRFRYGKRDDAFSAAMPGWIAVRMEHRTAAFADFALHQRRHEAARVARERLSW